MKTISRKEAKAAGLKRYFTGKPCPHGHVVERRIVAGGCVECERIGCTKWREDHRAVSRAASTAWAKAHPDRVRSYDAKRQKANPGRGRAYKIAWKKANPGMVNAHTAMRRSRKLRATPPWSNLELIAAVYVAATSKGLEVDHIVPLSHPLVCGLHVPFNLQLLTRVENAAKGNTFPYDKRITK